MSAFERAAAERLIGQAAQLGVTVPEELHAIVCSPEPNHGAQLWAQANPDAVARGEFPRCCPGAASGDAEDCTCWVPVFNVDQQEPRRVSDPKDLPVQASMCGDCAYRPGSPERDGSWMQEHLLTLPSSGRPFFCHDGMRRPTRWVHPDGRTVPGSPDDWQPPIKDNIPYRADGTPAALCAGWAALALAAARKDTL